MNPDFHKRIQELAKENNIPIEVKLSGTKWYLYYKKKKIKIEPYSWKCDKKKWDEIILGTFSMLVGFHEDEGRFIYDPKAYFDFFLDDDEKINRPRN